MYHFFIAPEQLSGDSAVILGSDVHHIGSVLRMKPGEKLMVNAGGDWEYLCEIAEIERDSVSLRVLEGRQETRELPISITLYQGLPKAEKMELIVQKAVELGVAAIVPVEMHRSVVRLDEKKAAVKQKRWQAIAEAAAKQAGRSVIPEVSLPLSFKEALRRVEAEGTELRLLPYERAAGMAATRDLIRSVKAGQRVAVMIGPEGGFEETEVEAAEAEGFHALTLGKRILRTETAGLVMLSLLMAETEED